MWAPLHRHRTAHKIESAWPIALLLLAGALQAGLPLAEALDIFLAEAPGPLRDVLAARAARCPAWMPLQEKIERLFAEEYLALPKAILLFSHESGGKLAGLISTSAALLEKKRELKEKVSVLTAEGRLSAWVVGASPFVLLLFLGCVSPDFVRPLFVFKTGWLLLGTVVLLVGTGLFFVHRAVRVEP